MRHRRHGRVLGRSPSHRQALYRNLASALFLTERPESEFDPNAPKVKGRIITTLAKAKEIRPLVEKCITLGKKGVIAQANAAQFGTTAERNSAEWKAWREGDEYPKWVQAMSPAVHARRRALQALGDKQAVSILFNDIAVRFADRPGGYTRVLRLATPRLGDAGDRAILEFVGKNDRVVKRSEKPDFGGEQAEVETATAE
jgi:large subunit ribosomal protein L17